jgi:hypothetical protein
MLAAIGSVPWLALRGPFEFAVNNRVDSLAVFFGVAGLLAAAVDREHGWRWSIPLLLLAGFTKSTAAASVGLAIFVDLLLAKRFRAAAAFAGLLAAGVGACLAIGDACSAGNFSQCLLGSQSELRWQAGVMLTVSVCKQPILPLGIVAACFLLRDPRTRLLGMLAVICFVVTVATSAKIGSNYNYFLEPSWAALFCGALALGRWEPRPAYAWVAAATGALLVQSAVRMTPHVAKHYERIAQWQQTVLAVQKYGQSGPLLTMQVGAQVLSGQQPYVADVFILSCLNRLGKFDVGPVLEDLRRQRIAAVIARDDIRPDLPGDVIWTDDERALVAAYYRPIEQFGDLTVFIPRSTPKQDIPLRASTDKDRTGPYRSFHQNGQKAWETHWVHGRMHGPERFWDSSGRLWRELHYVDGQRQGPETTWYENGQMASMAQYVSGRRHGPEITWYEDGRKWTETPYRDGVPDGLSMRWDPEGKVLGKTSWDRGVMRRRCGGPPEGSAEEVDQEM